MIPKFASSPHTVWEYRHFSYSLQQVETTWSTLADYGYSPEPLARDYFWQLCEADIVAELQRWEDEGWESTEPASPNGLYLDCSEYIEESIDVVEVMMWIATFGIALLINILFGRQARRYLVYKPSEYSLLMRRSIPFQDDPYFAAWSSSACMPF